MGNRYYQKCGCCNSITFDEWQIQVNGGNYHSDTDAAEAIAWLNAIDFDALFVGTYEPAGYWALYNWNTVTKVGDLVGFYSSSGIPGSKGQSRRKAPGAGSYALLRKKMDFGAQAFSMTSCIHTQTESAPYTYTKESCVVFDFAGGVYICDAPDLPASGYSYRFESLLWPGNYESGEEHTSCCVDCTEDP